MTDLNCGSLASIGDGWWSVKKHEGFLFFFEDLSFSVSFVWI
jgi:hypothetical protein